MTESERLAIADRARRAKEFLDSDVMKDALEGLERANLEILLALGPEMDLERRDKVNQINAIRAVKAQLQAFVTEGEGNSPAAAEDCVIRGSGLASSAPRHGATSP